MKPAPFAYRRPGSLAEAVAALAGDPGAKVLAGGQSLVPLLSMRLAAPSMLVDINGLPGAGRHHRRRVRRHGRRAGPARRRARLAPTYAGCSRWSRWRSRTSRTPPSATAAPRSARSCTPTPPRRCRSCSPCSAARSRSRGRAGGAPSPPASSTSARSSRACTTTRSRSRRSSRPSPRAPAWPSTRSPAGTATTRWSAPPRSSTATRSGSATSRWPTSRPWSTSPGVPDDRLGDVALEQLEPGDDIHATADYRAQLVRVLTARVVRSAREGGSA